MGRIVLYCVFTITFCVLHFFLTFLTFVIMRLIKSIIGTDTILTTKSARYSSHSDMKVWSNLHQINAIHVLTSIHPKIIATIVNCFLLSFQPYKSYHSCYHHEQQEELLSFQSLASCQLHLNSNQNTSICRQV